MDNSARHYLLPGTAMDHSVNQSYHRVSQDRTIDAQGTFSDYQIIGSTGNGSCGPNSLSIIFVSYLLNRFYEQHSIDLTEFAYAWNLYYPNDQITVIDEDTYGTYHHCGIDEDEAIKSLAIRVREKLVTRLGIGTNGSFKDAEILVAPVIRFYHLLMCDLLQTDAEPQDHAADRLGGQARDKRLCLSLWMADADVLNTVTKVVDEVKYSMSCSTASTNYCGGLNHNTDNGPRFSDFYNEFGMNRAATLLKLQLNYAIQGPYVYRGDNECFYLNDPLSWQIFCLNPDNKTSSPSRSSIHFHQNRLDTLGFTNIVASSSSTQQHQRSLHASIINDRNIHYNAALPAHLMTYANENGYGEYDKLLLNHYQLLRNDRRDDYAVYNPAGLTDTKRFYPVIDRLYDAFRFLNGSIVRACHASKQWITANPYVVLSAVCLIAVSVLTSPMVALKLAAFVSLTCIAYRLVSNYFPYLQSLPHAGSGRDPVSASRVKKLENKPRVYHPRRHQELSVSIHSSSSTPARYD